jgi:hypothetical protein
MKRQGVGILAAVLAVAGIGGCFDDPTSSLREGPATLRVSRSATTLATGDSVLVEVNVLDGAGNPLPVGTPTWTSNDPAVATVADAGVVSPGGDFHRVFIKAVAANGGITTVRVTAQGLTDSTRVVVLPAAIISSLYALSGPTVTDTVGIGTPNATEIQAQDTITINAPPGHAFSASSQVLFGLTPGYTLSLSATQIKAVARAGYSGPVSVSDVVFLGNAQTGQILLSSVELENDVTIAGVRFRGTVSVANSAFGPATLLTLDAPAGVTFSTAAPLSTVRVDTLTPTIVSRTATQITAITTATVTGAVKVTNLNIGTVPIDSMFATTASTINASFFPGTVVNGGGALLDTIVVAGAGQATFTTAGATASQVTVNGTTAFIISRTADTILAIAKLIGTDVVSISNVIVSGSTIPSLSTQGALAVGPATGEANEPGNDNLATATPLAITGTYQTLYGAVQSSTPNPFSNPTADFDDLYQVTLSAPARIRTLLAFLGTGAGGSSGGNPDIDVLVLNATGDFCDEFGGGFVEDDCTGATGAQPENGITQTLPAGTYYILVELFRTGGVADPIPYQLQYRTEP